MQFWLPNSTSFYFSVLQIQSRATIDKKRILRDEMGIKSAN